MVGIDTVRLRLMNYEIDDDVALHIRLPEVEHKTGQVFDEHNLFKTRSGIIVSGSRAYANHELLNVTLSPVITGDIPVQMPGIGLFVQTSLPKFFTDGKSNLDPISNKESVQVLNALELTLKGIGIHTNIWESELSRVDTFSNVRLDHPFDDYAPVLNCLQAKLKKRINYGVTTFLWHNKQSELTCYDKILEMEFQELRGNINPKRLQMLDRRIARFEHRFKTKKTLNRNGFTVLKQLKNDDGIDELKMNYISEFKENIFKVESTDLIGWIKKETKQDVKKFMDFHGRRWLNKFILCRGADLIVQMLGKVNFREIVFELTDDRNKAWRVEKFLDRVLEYNPNENGFSWQKINELYVELKSKFILQKLNG